ncbi:Abi family protein [Halosquirtibacter xylanolyticus]|uniref:Abi family protein n=1 Tax=Halosquirtibacter xylanolyticus TaxID=3374599 RepID=UPI0037489684|nr:Abi family protein [Prolixibacteraceae bacterium]
MKYTKSSLSIVDQIERLKSRGLTFNDEEKAAHTLSNISYYRLRAYTYPFQDNENVNHPFKEHISFEEILQLYYFDAKLRRLVFEALENIEVALRTQIIYHMSLAYGSHWMTEEDQFINSRFYNSNLISIKEELNRSKETFINHYKQKYNEPQLPPSWMSLEVVSMGLLSQVFSNIKPFQPKRDIQTHFGHKRDSIFKSWIHSFVGLRNICAHHGRLWNRRFTIRPTLPTNSIFHFLDNSEITNNKLYAMLSCLNYTLRCIQPDSDWLTRIKTHLVSCPLANLHHMGFPDSWESERLWEDNKHFIPIIKNNL